MTRRRLGLALVASLLLALAPGRASAQPEDVHPPRLLEGGTVELPEGTLPPPEGGAVGLLLTIDAQGKVVGVEVESPLREDIDALVVEQARRMRFEPARRGDEPIPSRIRFRLVVLHAGAEDAEAGRELPPNPYEEPLPEVVAADVVPEGEYETVVRGLLIPPEPGASSRLVLHGEELTTIPGTFGEPLRVVATLPGVARSPFGLGYFLVRGASFENTGFFVDGYPVPILYHLFAGPAVLSSRLVERMDFHPGGYPVAYGRFNAGIIALHTAPPPADGLHLEAEVDLFRASALAVVPFADGGGSVAAAYRRSYYELLLPLVVDDVSVSYSDYQLRGDYRITPKLEASVFVFGSADAFDVSQAAGAGETALTTQIGVEYGFLRAIGALRWRLPEDASLTWSGMIGRDRMFIQSREPGRPDFVAEVNGTYIGERVEAVLPAAGALRTTVGVDLGIVRYDLGASVPAPLGLGEFPRPDFDDPQVIDLDSRVSQLAIAFYAEQVLTAGPVELVPGIRADTFEYGDVSTVVADPRGVVRLHVDEGVTVKASSGLFAQPPAPLQLDRELGNPKLRPLRSWQSSTGVELLLPGALELGPTAFYSDMWRLPRVSGAVVVDEEGNVVRELLVDDGQGRAYGLELLLRRRVEEGLFGWLSYTLARSERFLEGGEVMPFLFDQTHTLNLALSYRTGPWRVGARFTLSTGRPTSEVVGAVYDADADRHRPTRTGFTSRLPTYHQLDVRADREFGMGPLDCSAYLDVINVYNASNAEGQIYQYDYARSTELPGIPILPTLGLRCELE